MAKTSLPSLLTQCSQYELLLGNVPCGGAGIGRMVVCLGSMLAGELVDDLVMSVDVPALWKVPKEKNVKKRN